MKTALFILVCTSLSRGDAAETLPDRDKIFYLKDAKAKDATSEVLDLELHEDGSFHNGSYKRSFDDIRHNFELWRKWGGDPLVIPSLYPSLRSNNDLKRLRQIAAFFDAEKVPWQFAIFSEHDPVPEYLRSKPSKRQR